MVEPTSMRCRLPVWFFLLYALTAGSGAVYNTFMPVHLSNIGFSGTQIGFLLALGPLMILVSQPFWGTAGDRSRSVNRVFRWILGGSALTVAIIPLTQNYYLLLVIVCAYAFFNSPAFAIQDTLTLQAIEKTDIRYGTVRIGSTTGFAVTSIVAGLIAKWDLRALFPLAGLLALLSFLLTYRLPTITGHQTRENRMSPAVLLKNRELILLTAFCFLCMLSMGYYNSFFSIYFVELGGDSSQLGVFWFISALVEIPFLLLAERIIKRFGIHRTLLVSGIVMCIRWLLLFFVQGVFGAMLTGILHGYSFIVLVYSMATYINRHVPPELKSTGQNLQGLFGIGIPKILASFFGGMANDWIGIRPVFLICALINIFAIAVIGVAIFRHRKLQAIRSTDR
ncbi:MAG: MFS transporter [Saccharofermentanales bacterium]